MPIETDHKTERKQLLREIRRLEKELGEHKSTLRIIRTWAMSVPAMITPPVIEEMCSKQLGD